MSSKKEKVQPTLDDLSASSPETAPEPKIIREPTFISDRVSGNPDSNALSEQMNIKENANEVDKYIQLVVFSLGDELFGLAIERVESIIKMQPITAIPQVKPYVLGVTNLRGTVLPVFDLRKRFGLPEDENLTDARIVIVLIKGEKVGIVVDAVSEVTRVSFNAIEPPPPMVSGIDTAYITGIAQQDGKLIVLLDVEQSLV
jgi:purine-binding chemotaxis protein CheW